MDETITDSAKLLPWDVWLSRTSFRRNMPRCLADDFKEPCNCKRNSFVGDKTLLVNIFGEAQDLIACVKHVLDANELVSF